MAQRSPNMGYNHNVRYGGRLFHVQTEDSGADNPHLFTHLFYEGTILASKKQDYDGGATEAEVRVLMQTQHKAIMKELKLAVFDEKIALFFAVRNEPAIPDEPEQHLPKSGPGAGIQNALDLDAIGPRTGPIARNEPDLAPNTSFARKGGPTERVSMTRPRATTRSPGAPPVVTLQPGQPRRSTLKMAIRKLKPVWWRWLSWLFPVKKAPEPSTEMPVPMEGAPDKPLLDVSDAEIEEMIGAFLAENPGADRT